MRDRRRHRDEAGRRPGGPRSRARRRLGLWVRRLTGIARRFRRRGRASGTVLCVEGWYYLLVLAFVFTAAMIREMNLMLMLVGMLFGPLVFNWRFVVLTLRGLEVRRRVPHGICAGDLLVVNVELCNRRKRVGSWAAMVEEQIRAEAGPGSGQTNRPTVLFLYVPAGQCRETVYRGRLPQRGRYRLGPVRVSTRFPFGLVRRWVTFEVTDTLTVYPRLGQLTRAWITRRHEAFEGSQRRERRHSRVTGDFYGVREWHDGDSPRWIHWRSSAKHGTLVVRQFEQQRNRDVVILLDLWQPAVPKAADLDNVELAVSFAATAVADLCRKGGSDLLVAVTGREPDCTTGPASTALLQEAMERLAVAEASSEDRLPALLNQALHRLEPGTQVILVSTRFNDLTDTQRFPTLWEDPIRRAAVRRIRSINAASDQLTEFFHPQ